MTQSSAPGAGPDASLVAARRTRMIVMWIYFAVVTAGVVWLWRGGHVWITRWADQAALCVALVCVLAAGRLLYESFNRRLLGDRMQVEGESTPQETTQARIQAVLIFLLGIALVLPNLTFAFDWSPGLAYGVIVAFVVVRTGYTLQAWKKADEFVRRRMTESAWWTLLVTTTGLLLYGGAERLGLTEEVTSWDVMILVFGVAIVMPSFLFRKPKSS
jgi:hypothetical protein